MRTVNHAFVAPKKNRSL